MNIMVDTLKPDWSSVQDVSSLKTGIDGYYGDTGEMAEPPKPDWSNTTQVDTKQYEDLNAVKLTPTQFEELNNHRKSTFMDSVRGLTKSAIPVVVGGFIEGAKGVKKLTNTIDWNAGYDEVVFNAANKLIDAKVPEGNKDQNFLKRGAKPIATKYANELKPEKIVEQKTQWEEFISKTENSINHFEDVVNNKFKLTPEEQESFGGKLGNMLWGTVPGFVPGVMFSGIYGQSYTEAIRTGKDERTAQSYALSQAIIGEALARFGSAKLLKGLKAEGSIIKTSGAMGLTQGTLEASNMATQMLFNVNAPEAEEIRTRMVDGVVLGTVTGGLFAGAGKLVSKAKTQPETVQPKETPQIQIEGQAKAPEIKPNVEMNNQLPTVEQLKAQEVVQNVPTEKMQAKETQVIPIEEKKNKSNPIENIPEVLKQELKAQGIQEAIQTKAELKGALTAKTEELKLVDEKINAIEDVYSIKNGIGANEDIRIKNKNYQDLLMKKAELEHQVLAIKNGEKTLLQPQDKITLTAKEYYGSKMKELISAHETGIKETKETIAEVQNNFSKIVNRTEDISPELKNRLLTKTRMIQTPEDLAKAMPIIKEVTGKYIEQQSVKEEVSRFKELTQKTKKLSSELQAQVNDIAQAYQPHALSEAKKESLLNMQKALEGSEYIPQEIKQKLERLTKTPLSEMGSEDIRLINDSIATIVKEDTARKEFVILGKLKKYEAVKEETIAAIEKNMAPDTRLVGETNTNRDLVTNVLHFGKEGSYVLHANPITLFHGIAKPVKDIHTDIVKGANEAQRFVYQIKDGLGEIYNRLGISPEEYGLVKTNIDKDILAYRKRAINTETLTNAKFIELKGKGKFTYAETMAILNTAKDPKGLATLKDGGFILDRDRRTNPIKLTEEDLQALDKELPSAGHSLTNYIFGLFNGDGQILSKKQEAFEALNGYPLKISTDPHFPMNKQVAKTGESLLQMSAYDGQVVTRKWLEALGFLKARTGDTKTPLIIKPIQDIVASHANSSARLANMAEPIRQMIQVVGDPDIEKAFIDSGRKLELDQAKKWILDISKGALPEDDITSGLFSWAKATFVKQALGWSVGAILKGPISFMGTVSHIGFDNAKLALKAYAPAAIDKRIPKLIEEYTADTRSRYEGKLILDPSGEVRQTIDGDSLFAKHLTSDQKAFYGFTKLDRLNLRATWAIAEKLVERDMPELKVGSKEYYTEVGHLTDEIVFNSQTPVSPINMTPVARSSNPLVRGINMFMNPSNAQLNIAMRAYQKWNDSPSDKNFKEFLYASTIGVIASSALVSAVDQIMQKPKLDKRQTEEDPEMAAKRYVLNNIKNELGNIYFVGNPITTAINNEISGSKRTSSFNPSTDLYNSLTEAFSILADAYTSAKKRYNARETMLRQQKQADKNMKAILLLGGVVLDVSAASIDRAIEKAYNLVKDQGE